jgi:plasmid stabilization system protein ParE
MRYRLLAPARREYLEAVRWYRDEVDDLDLARDFIIKLRQRLERVQQRPHAGALVTGIDAAFPIRRVKLHRFPFHLFVAVRDEEIVVLAIAHERRAPRYWAERLDDL